MASEYLSCLIEKLAVNKKVVVLIDEYDKALMDHLENLDVAIKIREILKEFYSILKVQDSNLKFILLTGVTKFSKASVFSGLNNLNDLTLSNDYATLLGYTREEIERYFLLYVQEIAHLNHWSMDQCYVQIKEWYNGYKFSKQGELVYNPFSTLKLFDSRDFAAYWFDTGTPTFLIRLLKTRELDLVNLEQYKVSSESFSSFEIENLPILPLLYQDRSLPLYLVGVNFDSATRTIDDWKVQIV